MAWLLDKNRQISVKIAQGEYKVNERIPSVREIAVEAGVNPNTVQKALAYLIEQGLLYSVRGAGIYVSQGVENAEKKLVDIKRMKTESFFEEMHSLGMTIDEIKKYVEEWKE